MCFCEKHNGVQEAVSSILATRTRKSNDFTQEIVGFFFVYGLVSFGFDHNFDHNAGGFIWSMQGQVDFLHSRALYPLFSEKEKTVPLFLSSQVKKLAQHQNGISAICNSTMLLLH